ncbi:hypothetical protein [Rhodococcus opacus]|uniref:hypothetical protein n=1 Tax=Rhodococcus opacus TaxID=37919 RepID=UPI0005C1E717|nr:hypothetical protein [Rhodococcus opacus]
MPEKIYVAVAVRLLYLRIIPIIFRVASSKCELLRQWDHPEMLGFMIELTNFGTGSECDEVKPNIVGFWAAGKKAIPSFL